MYKYSGVQLISRSYWLLEQHNKMNSKVVLIFSTLAFIAQVAFADEGDKTDPRLQACANKFIDQFEKVKFDKLPNCYDKQKLEEGKKATAVFHDFYETIPDNCKKPNKENISQCLKTISKLMDERSDEMKAGIVNSIHSFLLGGKQCYDEFKNLFSNLDTYVLNGCQDA